MRRPAAAWAAAVALAAALASAPACAKAAAAAADSSHQGPRPFFVMLHSAAVPGLGQVENRAWIKAAGVVGGEGYLAWRGWSAWRDELAATDRANETAALSEAAAAAGDPATEQLYAAANARYLADRDRHRNAKINYIWWAAAAHLLQMVDAYVDAHFTTFDADFGPDDTDAAAGPRVSIALRARF